MPVLQNPITIDSIDNQVVFDKKIWDLSLPIKIISHSQILQSPLVNIVGSTPLDSGGVYQDTIYTRRLTGEPEELVSRTKLTPEGISQFMDSCIAIFRGKSWMREEIAKNIIGADLLAEIEKATTQYWADKYQKYILMMLSGIFEGTLKNTHQLIVPNHSMNWQVVAAAKAMLGDAHKDLGVIIMHSKQLATLVSSGLVKYYNASELGYKIWTGGQIPTINGLQIIETDTVPITQNNGVTLYHSYIGAQGVIDFKVIEFNNKPYWGDEAGGTDYFMQTCKLMLRVPGVRFLRDQASDRFNFKNVDLANPACWQKIVEDDKEIPFIELITKADSLLDELTPPPSPPPSNG